MADRRSGAVVARTSGGPRRPPSPRSTARSTPPRRLDPARVRLETAAATRSSCSGTAPSTRACPRCCPRWSPWDWRSCSSLRWPGALLARRALEPVERMRRQVDAIPGDALDRRIGEGRPDELGRLAAAFNRLLSAPSWPPSSSSGSWPTRRTSCARRSRRCRVTPASSPGRRSAATSSRPASRLRSWPRPATGWPRTLGELLALAESDGARRRAGRRCGSTRWLAEAVEELRAAYPDRRDRPPRLPQATVDGRCGPAGRDRCEILLDNALKYSPAGTPSWR